MTDHRKTAQAASEWGRTVARILELNKAEDPVRPETRNRFRACLDQALMKAEKPVEAQLLAILRLIRQKPELQASLALMENFWRLPAGSQVEDGVVRVVQRCYIDCRARKPEDFERLDNALRESQWSPFPTVRQVAHKIQQMAPVGEHEIRVLEDRDDGYVDLRLSIADRALRHRQLEHLDAVLTYMINVLKSSAEQKEIREVRLQFRMLRTFSLSTELLLLIFKHYQASYYHSPDVRGRLMSVLSAAGDSLVPGLMGFWEQADSESTRGPIVRLLQQMIEFGSQKAVDALGDIVWTSQGHELNFACRCFLDGASSQASRGMTRPWSRLIRESLNQFGERLEGSFLPEHAELREQIRKLPWDADADRLWVQKIIKEGFVAKDLKRLRTAGLMEYEILKSAIIDSDGLKDSRRRAMKSLGYLNVEMVQRTDLGFLWQIYEDEDDVELRRAALETLRDLEFQAEEWMRDRLFHDREGEPKLRQTIEDIWGVLFQSERPDQHVEDAVASEASWTELLEGESLGGSETSAEPETAAPRSARLKIFLYHAPDHLQQARVLYRELRDRGFQPWLESENLMAGQSVETEIKRQLRGCDAVVALVGASLQKQAGLEQKIMVWALEARRERPPNAIFLIPVLVEDCELPEDLRGLGSVRFFEGGGHEKLTRALEARGTQLLSTSG